MRAQLEVDRAHPRSADPAATPASVLAETVGLQRLVDDLLLLARGDAAALDGARRRAGRPRRRRSSGWPRAGAARGPGSTPAASTRSRSGATRRSSAGRWRNLLDNAVRHARGAVTVTLGGARRRPPSLTVADDGPGVPVEERERVFERFTRLDDARSATTAAPASAWRSPARSPSGTAGTLALTGSGSGARFVLRLPVGRPHPEPPTVRR